MTSDDISTPDDVLFNCSPELNHRVATTAAKLQISTNIVSLVPAEVAAPIAPTSDDDDMEPLPSKPSGVRLITKPSLLQISMSYIDYLLSNLNPRWKNWIIRAIFTVFMILAFAKLVASGPLAVLLTILLLQCKCFHEVITIGYAIYNSHDLPWFCTLSWYFWFTANYSLYGENVINHFDFLMSENCFIQSLITYHRIIAFLLYTGGFFGFVLSLKKRFYLKQFTLFGYTQLALLIFVTSTQQMIRNMYQGMVWFLFPISLVVCNDIMAYLFGFFCGRTPLTKLSPKKTWEGFIGGGCSTIILGFFLADRFCRYHFLVCPLKYDDGHMGLSTSCSPSPIFQLTTYTIPTPFSLFKFTLDLYPFQFHSLFLSLFASSIGPFGGFFASGFKRAFRIKDFAATIPGHGGFVVSDS